MSTARGPVRRTSPEGTGGTSPTRAGGITGAPPREPARADDGLTTGGVPSGGEHAGPHVHGRAPRTGPDDDGATTGARAGRHTSGRTSRTSPEYDSPAAGVRAGPHIHGKAPRTAPEDNSPTGGVPSAGTRAGPRGRGRPRRAGPGLPCGRAWLRVFVLLLAVLVLGGPAEASATPAGFAEIVEYDVLDTALRPPARVAHRPVVPLRPAPPRTHPAPGAPQGRPLPAMPRPPYALHTLRTVVLRC